MRHFTFTVNGVKCEWECAAEGGGGSGGDEAPAPDVVLAAVRKAAQLFAADRWGPGELRVLDEARRQFAWAS